MFIATIGTRGDVQPYVALVEAPEGRAAIAGASGSVRGMRALIRLIRQSFGIQRDLFRDGWTAAQAANPGVVVYHPKMAIARHYAERLRIPAVMATLFPTFLPTGAHPNPGFPALNLGQRLTATYNRATHHLVQTVVSAGFPTVVCPFFWRSVVLGAPCLQSWCGPGSGAAEATDCIAPGRCHSAAHRMCCNTAESSCIGPYATP